MNIPSLMTSVHPANSDHDDSSSRADTTSSESLRTMMRNFQFPVPPIRNVPRIPPMERRDVGPLPRNNSWAIESPPPNNQALQKVLDARSIEAYIDTPGGLGRSTLTNSLVRTPSPLKGPPLFTSSEGNPVADRDVTQRYDHTARELIGASTDRPNTTQEDLWTDIAETPAKQQGDLSSDKENVFEKAFSFTTNDDAVGSSIAKPTNRHKQTEGTAKGGFTIFVDENERHNHPQPLSAHPSKKPSISSRRPLAPTSVNTSRLSPSVRAPWYRQKKARNGSGGNHRSSIYGPGALARKIQQEVMITVNIELDILRREMNERFAFQKTEFEFEIKKSQVWTLRVEDENRKLREELAKERKRREGERERREGERTGVRLNLC